MGGDLLGAQRICFRDDEKVIQARIKIPGRSNSLR
jgi:hypothetical protein